MGFTRNKLILSVPNGMVLYGSSGARCALMEHSVLATLEQRSCCFKLKFTFSIGVSVREYSQWLHWIHKLAVPFIAAHGRTALFIPIRGDSFEWTRARIVRSATLLASQILMVVPDRSSWVACRLCGVLCYLFNLTSICPCHWARVSWRASLHVIYLLVLGHYYSICLHHSRDLLVQQSMITDWSMAAQLMVGNECCSMAAYCTYSHD